MFFFLFLESLVLPAEYKIKKSAKRMDITPRKIIERHLRSLPLMRLDTPLGFVSLSE